MRKMAPGSYKFALAGALMLCAALSVKAGDVMTVHVQTHDGVPLVGHTVSLYLEPSHVLVSSQTTNASGDCILTDNAFVGQNRCLGVEEKPGYIFEGGNNGDPNLRPVRNPVCFNVFGAYEIYYWALRKDLKTVTVVGGADGYVNPNRGETAKIIVSPAATGNVEIKIYTSRGKLVISKSRPVNVGIHTTVEWDGKDSAGQTVPTGIYIAHVVAPGAMNLKVKIAIVKK